TVHLLGSCIGCSLALSLIQRQPHRVTAAVLQQPLGRTPENIPQSRAQVQRWADSIPDQRRPDPDVVESIYPNLYDGDFVFSVTREFVKTCPTPMLVLPGEDAVHPREIALELAELAPRATVIENWKTGGAELVEQIRTFLHRHAPNGGARP